VTETNKGRGGRFQKDSEQDGEEEEKRRLSGVIAQKASLSFVVTVSQRKRFLYFSVCLYIMSP